MFYYMGFILPPFSLSMAVESKSAPYIPIIPALTPGTSTRDDTTNKNLSLTAAGIDAPEAKRGSVADLHHISDCVVHQKI